MSSSPEEESPEVKAIKLHLESAKHQVTITKEHADWANYQLDESKKHLKDVQRMLKEAKIRVSLDQTEEEDASIANEEQFVPTANDIILSLHNENYRKIMFSSFIQLAKEGDSKKKEIAIQIYNYFKCNVDGDSGKFYKVYSNGKSYFEVDDGAALQSKFIIIS